MRTRSAAAKLVADGAVRLNGERISASSQLVRAGDVVTVALGYVKILKVLGFSDRRGGADSVAALSEDLTPPPPPREPPVAERDAGSGRPTKRDRRAIDRLRHDEN